jgi:hypothetical protein
VVLILLFLELQLQLLAAVAGVAGTRVVALLQADQVVAVLTK